MRHSGTMTFAFSQTKLLRWPWSSYFYKINYYDDSETPYKISSTVSKKHSNGFKLNISVHNFPAFVTSYGQYYTDDVPLQEVDWFLQLYLGWYNPSSKKYETLSDPPEHTPEMLMFFVGGESYDEDADWSADVRTIFNFKRKQDGNFVDFERQFSQKFRFTSANDHVSEYCPFYIKIDVSLFVRFFRFYLRNDAFSLSRICLTRKRAFC